MVEGQAVQVYQRIHLTPFSDLKGIVLLFFFLLQVIGENWKAQN